MIAQSSDSFVPLTAAPASANAREFRVAVLNHANGQAQSPAADAKKNSGFVALESLPPAAHHVNGAPKKSCEPRVTVQRDGNRVTHLRIQCSCSQIMELACVYDAAGTAE